MAFVGECIENPMAGIRAQFSDLGETSGGRRAELEYSIRPNNLRDPTEHYHTRHIEQFTILAGVARYRIGRTEREVSSTESFTISPNLPHIHPWNIGQAELRIRLVQIFTAPALEAIKRHAEFFETHFGLARDGQVNHRGIPNLLQVSVMAQSLYPYTYAGSLSPRVQTPVINLLAALGKQRGYRATYPRYVRTA